MFWADFLTPPEVSLNCAIIKVMLEEHKPMYEVKVPPIEIVEELTRRMEEYIQTQLNICKPVSLFDAFVYCS